jgi:hypothetical protein
MIQDQDQDQDQICQMCRLRSAASAACFIQSARRGIQRLAKSDLSTTLSIQNALRDKLTNFPEI